MSTQPGDRLAEVGCRGQIWSKPEFYRQRALTQSWLLRRVCLIVGRRREEGGVAVIIEAHKEHATATVSQWTHRITSTQLASPFFVNLDYHRHHHHHDGNMVMVKIHDQHRDEDHQLRSSFRLRLEHQSNLCIHSSTLCLSTIQPINFNKIL